MPPSAIAGNRVNRGMEESKPHFFCGCGIACTAIHPAKCGCGRNAGSRAISLNRNKFQQFINTLYISLFC